MALALTAAVDRIDAAVRLGIRFRIGIHCGPVVAGVIGTRKFIYDIWGDAVNLASRMESLGAPGRIQVTHAVQERLEGRYLLEPRGLIEVKGKGPTPAWYLLARDGASGDAPDPVASADRSHAVRASDRGRSDGHLSLRTRPSRTRTRPNYPAWRGDAGQRRDAPAPSLLGWHRHEVERERVAAVVDVAEASLRFTSGRAAQSGHARDQPPSASPADGASSATRPGGRPVRDGVLREGEAVSRLQAKSLDDPDEVRPTPFGRVDVYNLDDSSSAGWCSSPAGTGGARPAPGGHEPVPVPPRRRLRLRAAREPAGGRHNAKIGPGMVYEIPPGHDGWVVVTRPGSPTTWPACARSRGPTRDAARPRCRAVHRHRGSTALAESMGPTRWREVVGMHNERVLLELDRFRAGS